MEVVVLRCKCCGAQVLENEKNRYTVCIPEIEPWLALRKYDAYDCHVCGYCNLGKAHYEGEVKNMVCKVCGVEFAPKKENKYIAKVVKRTSMLTADMEYYDAFNCPQCGCQQLAGLRNIECEEPKFKTVTIDLKEKVKE